MAKKSGFTDEIEALGAVLDALNDLDEEKRVFVYRTAGERLGLAAPTQRKDKSPGSGADIDGDDIGSQDDITPKEFMKGKKAKTDVEIIACLAFYLSHYRDAATFKTKDITVLNIEAALPKMSNSSQAMKNATNQNHYLAAAGKGMKQITSLGEDVVKALPIRDKVKEVLDNSQKPKRRKKRNKKKKKAKTSTKKTARKKVNS